MVLGVCAIHGVKTEGRRLCNDIVTVPLQMRMDNIIEDIVNLK